MGFLELFSYSFIIRAFEAGIIVALIAPLIGIFLVLRRYSLIADTLSHVSLAGIAVGLLSGIHPMVAALAASVLSGLAIERLRLTKKIFSETTLAIFLSGGLAIAVVLVSVARGFNTDLFSYLFGSILTVKTIDLWIIGFTGLAVFLLVVLFFKEILYTSFDEEAARVSGIPTRFINLIFTAAAATTIALAIPIVGVLLISALIVIPVTTALQLKKSFFETLLWAEVFSVVSVISGIVLSFYLNLSAGGTIVLIMIALLGVVTFFRKTPM